MEAIRQTWIHLRKIFIRPVMYRQKDLVRFSEAQFKASHSATVVADRVISSNAIKANQMAAKIMIAATGDNIWEIQSEERIRAIKRMM